MLNVVETSTKTFCLYRFCLSTLGIRGILSVGILSGGLFYSKSSYFREGLSGGIMSGIRRN